MKMAVLLLLKMNHFPLDMIEAKIPDKVKITKKKKKKNSPKIPKKEEL